MSVNLTKQPAVPASKAEGYVVILPTTNLPAGIYASAPVEFNVFTVRDIDGTDVELFGQVLMLGHDGISCVSLPAGRALAFAE